MTEWQDISTAPKDGTPILVRGQGIYHGVEFVVKRCRPITDWGVECWRSLIDKQKIPDHCLEEWMPRLDPKERCVSPLLQSP